MKVGGDEENVSERVRDEGELGAEVAGVIVGDGAMLSSQERMDEADDANAESEGLMRGDGTGDVSSTAATCISVGGSVMRLLNNG